ncbi:c6 zinc finger domain protein [Fusarium flagelliforme]|uniref:C6 zinc finger domain protein n=1 Tax=Fusarium flagelliforme TaxID=2675880 RepID=A0A395MV52_9HYPO|nr:c6 zinc finger domain protein [Fusarium flagelliforme]
MRKVHIIWSQVHQWTSEESWKTSAGEDFSEFGCRGKQLGHIDWTNPGPSASTSLQVIGKAVEPTFGSSAPTWSPLEFGSADNDSSSWNNGFGFVESASLFAYNSFFGASPPITDTNTSPLYLLQSPSSTVSSDPHFSPDIPKECHASTIDDHTALMELSKINIDLHARISAAKSNNSHLTFDDLVYRQGPLYIDNYTLAEFILNISQSFLQVITGLLPASSTADSRIFELLSLSKSKSPQMKHVNPPSHSPSSHHAGILEPLSAPLALTITSIFIQLLSLYELTLEHITTRVDRLPIDPIAPIPILRHDTLVLESLCTQGAFFSRTIVHVLKKMQCVLGIDSGPGTSHKGLLTAKQKKVLWGELDGGRAIIPGQASMGPAILQRLFGKMETVLERIAADSS